MGIIANIFVTHKFRIFISVGLRSAYVCKNDKIFNGKNVSHMLFIYGCISLLHSWSRDISMEVSTRFKLGGHVQSHFYLTWCDFQIDPPSPYALYSFSTTYFAFCLLMFYVADLLSLVGPTFISINTITRATRKNCIRFFFAQKYHFQHVVSSDTICN